MNALANLENFLAHSEAESFEDFCARELRRAIQLYSGDEGYAADDFEDALYCAGVNEGLRPLVLEYEAAVLKGDHKEATRLAVSIATWCKDAHFTQLRSALNSRLRTIHAWQNDLLPLRTT